LRKKPIFEISSGEVYFVNGSKNQLHFALQHK